jgi:hypothetical protein
MVAFSKPVEGCEAEYNSWYNTIHLPDVLNVPGFSSAQRFKVEIPMVGEMPGRYLALYRMEADSPEAVEAAKKALMTAEMRQRDNTIDRSNGLFIGVFERVGPGPAVPGTKAGSFRMVSIAQPCEGREDEYAAWYAGRHMPEVLGLPGVISGQRYKLHEALMPGIDISSFALFEMAANSVEEARETLKAMATANLAKCTTAVPGKTRAAVLEAVTDRIMAPKSKPPA